MVAFSAPTIVVRGPGVQGAPGAAGVARLRMTAATTIHAGWAVAMDDQGMAYHPSRTVLADADRVIAVAAQAALAGELLDVVTLGPLTVGSWTSGTPLFVNGDGSLTSAPSSGLWQVQVAVATSSTELFVDIKPAIILHP